ncbi:MAG: DNA-directed RNA polymerase subunit beta' [Mycoplasmoidaceae bacterium]
MIKSKNYKINSIRIGIASPEKVLEWSNGEITKPETINYKSLKPEKSGLFDEAIFGPIKDFECACGKYKKVKYRGRKCETCGVDITESIVRRERLGHIALAAPVAHIWMTKELPFPSKISLLLDISYKEIEQVIYFVNYIVLDIGDHKINNKIFKFKEVVDLTTNKNSAKSSRGKIRRILTNIKKVVVKDSLDYRRANDYYESIKNSNLPFSIDEVFKFIQRLTGVRFGIGAEAIHELLENIDIEAEYIAIKQKVREVDANNVANIKKSVRRLEVIKWIKDSNNDPKWLILKNIVVTPPDTRPIIQLEGGKFTTSDINTFYRKIIIRNERLKKVISLKAPSIILNNEKRMLQEAVDALFDNSSKKKPIVGKDRRALKSFSDHLKGKQGLFRQNLLGKRVDYSGRSVIVVGPELKLYQVGIPVVMLLKLFKPFIIAELIKKRKTPSGALQDPYASNIKNAEAMLLRQDDVIWPIVEEVIKTRPVILNRAPTLHRMGIQAFEPKMIEGKAIRLHPLVTTAFNADFDGDQMAVHVPISKEAVNEARWILLASWHILGPKDGKPIIAPTQDMVLGNYYLTKEVRNKIGEGIIFNSIEELKNFYELEKVHTHTIIGISTKAFNPEKKFPREGTLVTTVGKVILNEILPPKMKYINDPKNLDQIPVEDIIPPGEDVRGYIAKKELYKPFDKKVLSHIVDILYKNFPIQTVPKTMDKIKDIGFKYSMLSATTISAFDVPFYDGKQKYFKVADQKIQELKHQFNKGLLTEDERYKRVVSTWTAVSKNVSNDIVQLIKNESYQNNGIVIMSESGARGNTSNFSQLAGMRGLMSKSYNYDQKLKSKVIKDIIEIPIKHSFIEGLSIIEYFNSSYGARKGMTDTAMKTSKSGYMTRKLVDATQDVIVTIEDCGSKYGINVKDIIDQKQNSLIESLTERLINRFPLNDIFSPKTGELIISANELISDNIAKKIVEEGIKEVEVRSVLKCRAMFGICQKCFGTDLTTNEMIEKNSAIGIIAAQSIGEPTTQLTMRTFHTGGVSGGTNITQGFERIKQLFDMIPPKEWERATIAEIDGEVMSIVEDGEEIIVTVSNKKDKERFYRVSINNQLKVKVGDNVILGQKITEGSINIRSLLKIAGIEKVRNYLLKEIQKVYRLQGIEIADKYVEIIIRQLTNKVQVFDPGDTHFFVGEIVNINNFRLVNEKLIKSGKKPRLATCVNTIYGLDEAPMKSDSFLSAASFQDTKKILTDASIKGQIDHLKDLKSNVIFGNLVPCGTGRKESSEIIEEGQKMFELEY